MVTLAQAQTVPVSVPHRTHRLTVLQPEVIFLPVSLQSLRGGDRTSGKHRACRKVDLAASDLIKAASEGLEGCQDKDIAVAVVAAVEDIKASRDMAGASTTSSNQADMAKDTLNTRLKVVSQVMTRTPTLSTTRDCTSSSNSSQGIQLLLPLDALIMTVCANCSLTEKSKVAGRRFIRYVPHPFSQGRRAQSGACNGIVLVAADSSVFRLMSSRLSELTQLTFALTNGRGLTCVERILSS